MRRIAGALLLLLAMAPGAGAQTAIDRAREADLVALGRPVRYSGLPLPTAGERTGRPYAIARVLLGAPRAIGRVDGRPEILVFAASADDDARGASRILVLKRLPTEGWYEPIVPDDPPPVATSASLGAVFQALFGSAEEPLDPGSIEPRDAFPYARRILDAVATTTAHPERAIPAGDRMVIGLEIEAAGAAPVFFSRFLTRSETAGATLRSRAASHFIEEADGIRFMLATADVGGLSFPDALFVRRTIAVPGGTASAIVVLNVSGGTYGGSSDLRPAVVPRRCSVCGLSLALPEDWRVDRGEDDVDYVWLTPPDPEASACLRRVAPAGEALDWAGACDRLRSRTGSLFRGFDPDAALEHVEVFPVTQTAGVRTMRAIGSGWSGGTERRFALILLDGRNPAIVFASGPEESWSDRLQEINAMLATMRQVR